MLSASDTGDWIGCDPGTQHVGLSWWQNGQFVDAHEVTPNAAADMAFKWLTTVRLPVPDKVYCERYTPSGGFGNNVESAGTLELIGVLRHVCRSLGVEFYLIGRGDRDAARTRIVAAKAKVPNGDHALDATAVVVAAHRWGRKDIEARMSTVVSSS